ncbi:hypothetical protein V502_00046, partial [Pseudogymnoascus sp. VKM F-4520 (FW-2644)]
MNRTEKPPERAYALQKYLLLHSQHEALQRQQQRRGSISNAQLVGPSTMTRRPSLSALNDESVLGEIEYSENKLINVTEQIKCTLTDLLNSEGVKDDMPKDELNTEEFNNTIIELLSQIHPGGSTGLLQAVTALRAMQQLHWSDGDAEQRTRYRRTLYIYSVRSQEMSDDRDRQQEPNNSQDPPRQTRTKTNSTRPRGSSDPASYQPQNVKKQNSANGISRYQHLYPSDAFPAHQQFSLAGSLAQQPHAPSYIDPKYYELNPGYQKLRNTPVWGLAKPLPRVVRPGMKRKLQNGQQVVEVEGAEMPEPGSAHAIPQTGMIDDQRQDVGKERIGGSKDVEARGYGHQGGGRRRSERMVQRVGSYNDVVDQNWTPSVERDNPMEDW